MVSCRLSRLPLASYRYELSPSTRQWGALKLVFGDKMVVALRRWGMPHGVGLLAAPIRAVPRTLTMRCDVYPPPPPLPDRIASSLVYCLATLKVHVPTRTIATQGICSHSTVVVVVAWPSCRTFGRPPRSWPPRFLGSTPALGPGLPTRLTCSSSCCCFTARGSRIPLVDPPNAQVQRTLTT